MSLDRKVLVGLAAAGLGAVVLATRRKRSRSVVVVAHDGIGVERSDSDFVTSGAASSPSVASETSFVVSDSLAKPSPGTGQAVLLSALFGGLLLVCPCLFYLNVYEGVAVASLQTLSYIVGVAAISMLAIFWRIVWGRVGSADVAAALGSGKVAAEPVSVAPTPPQDLNGVWMKDVSASDSMEPAMDVMQLNPLMRLAVRLIRGIHITMTSHKFRMSMLTPFGWFQVTEEYRLNGEPSLHNRRDLRRGRHTGFAEQDPVTGGVRLTLSWEQPLAGEGTDVFFSPAPGVLYVDSCMLMASGAEVQYRTVYKLQRA